MISDMFSPQTLIDFFYFFFAKKLSHFIEKVNLVMFLPVFYLPEKKGTLNIF